VLAAGHPYLRLSLGRGGKALPAAPLRRASGMSPQVDNAARPILFRGKRTWQAAVACQVLDVAYRRLSRTEQAAPAIPGAMPATAATREKGSAQRPCTSPP